MRRNSPCRYGSILLLFCLFFLTAPLYAALSPEMRNSMVKIYTVSNRYNYHEPWQKTGRRLSHGSGCIIDGERILTNAHVVSDQTFIQVRRAGQAQKVPAQIEWIAHACDLALLKVKESRFFQGATPIPLGELPQLADEVTVYGFPAGGDKLSITQGVVSRIEHMEYNHSGAYLMGCQIDAAINTGSSGGPVLHKNRIAGVAFQTLTGNQLENTGYMVPAPIIKHFLADVQDGTHHGIPALGLETQRMENSHLRRLYQMQSEHEGVMIVHIDPQSPAQGFLQAEDILLSVEGSEVANDGTVEFRPGERTYLEYPLQQKFIGQTLSVRFLRHGKEQTCSFPLTQGQNFFRLVPHKQYDTPPDYYIYGGLLFSPLTLDYLAGFGGYDHWFGNAPSALTYAFFYGRRQHAQHQVVVLTKVLADEFNQGYHKLENGIITKVDGEPISSMQELVQALDRQNPATHTIEDTHGYRIALPPASAEVKKRLQQRYNLKAWRSETLRGKEKLTSTQQTPPEPSLTLSTPEY